MKIATFNVENLDFSSSDTNPTIEQRAPLLRAQLERLDADVICFQEVHGQETNKHTEDNPDRELSAFEYILQGTKYEGFKYSTTLTSDNTPFNERNLVTLSAYPIKKHNQYKNNLIEKLQYKKVTANPLKDDAEKIIWERPILHAEIELPNNTILHVINLHLKSRISSNITGQKKDGYTWKSAKGWAEGYFLSSIKRVGQALETRVLIDNIFQDNPNAQIVVCGDFNSEPGEVPVEAILGKTENTNNPDLIDSVLIPCSNAIPESVRFSHYHHGHENLLDHILMSQSLLPYFKEAKIFNETLHDESLPYKYDTKYPGSDHAPFISHFLI